MRKPKTVFRTAKRFRGGKLRPKSQAFPAFVGFHKNPLLAPAARMRSQLRKKPVYGGQSPLFTGRRPPERKPQEEPKEEIKKEIKTTERQRSPKRTRGMKRARLPKLSREAIEHQARERLGIDQARGIYNEVRDGANQALVRLRIRRPPKKATTMPTGMQALKRSITTVQKWRQKQPKEEEQ